MALQLHLHLPASIGRVKSITCSPRARKVKTFATLSQPRNDTVNWVEATSSFFEQDKRPIMLFDGKFFQFSIQKMSLRCNLSFLIILFLLILTQGYAICVMVVSSLFVTMIEISKLSISFSLLFFALQFQYLTCLHNIVKLFYTCIQSNMLEVIYI
jgi:hypothetical protein